MPIQPINQTFAYGKQGTIEYKPNWGQPITEAGQWQGAPQGTTAPTAVTGGIDPYKTFDKNLNELKSYYKRREATLKGYRLPEGAHNKAVDQMQQEFDEARLKFTTTRLQLDDIKQGMASGQIDPTNGLQAQMELVAPQGTVEAMFPRPQKQSAVRHGRFSPQKLKTFG